jgi:hypothetical protein
MQKHIFTYGIGILLTACLFVSCQRDKRADSVRKVVAEWIGKQIVFPDGLPCTVMGRDTACISLSGASCKILLYIDSTGCMSCRLRLADWKKIVTEADSLFPGRVDFLFFFQPKNEKELTYLLKRDNFHSPVFFDRERRLDRLNRFPSVMEHQCFLLDADNKVVLIGNPALNPQTRELYKRQIGGNTAPAENTPRTTAVAEMQQQNLGVMQTGETYRCTYIIKNNGSRPLVIMDVKTSCGCTVPSWSRMPVAPGATTEAEIEVKPDTPGVFRKTVTVYGNMENPLQLAVTGEVINGMQSRENDGDAIRADDDTLRRLFPEKEGKKSK